MPVLLNKLLTEHAYIPLEIEDLVCSYLEQKGLKSHESYIKHSLSDFGTRSGQCSVLHLHYNMCSQSARLLGLYLSVDQCVHRRSSLLTRTYHVRSHYDQILWPNIKQNMGRKKWTISSVNPLQYNPLL